MGLSDWIAGITSRDPRWPADILKAAGGAPLSDAEIAKLIPEPDETDEAEETTQPRTGKSRTKNPSQKTPPAA